MKLLFTQDALVNAGAERSHLEILSRFSEEVEVVFVYFYPRHDLREEYERAGIRLIFLDIPETYHFTLAVSRLVKIIKNEKPELLISSLWRADIITRIASLLTGVPLIGTLVNDSYGTYAWKDKKGLKYKLVYWLDRLTAGIPKYWIANANALADSHVKTLGLDKDKIKVVYRGRNVPEEFWSKDSLREIGFRRDRPSARYHLNKDENINPFNFISYGRLLERKGFQDAIVAFSKVNQNYPDCTFTIFGDGPFRTELEKLIQDLNLKDSIILPGKIPNPIQLLTSGDNSSLVNQNIYEHHTTDIGHPTSFNCFLFPSWYEGFSGALVEAMMAGIPIIASDISMNLEAVSTENALIFEVQNSEQLANQMIFAIENPVNMAELGTKAREEAISRFDIEKIAVQYEQTWYKIYQNLRSEA
ncbi:glycosyltransferase family 4 protein [Algoriphagus winogradskyi]|uniref:Glycosyltransferase involved in cell wall bisynthesis n=1 Tax=Algoriphagus winogradskyi TaxID=237017 RepID=A0ABY1NVU6_9BACT|nr:glycosyltransferase family 4 protein [Algoriphagus winogradskyi]SMP19724.1 Glycosyltransferase involved in cell wall bisynthesis [Algoriphagus winogradskyi]